MSAIGTTEMFDMDWKVRGIGLEFNLPCFITKAGTSEPALKPNISGFVSSKKQGVRLVMMFDGLARLDYREYEPNWIQVKVGVIPQHEKALVELQRRVIQNGNRVTAEIIEDVRKYALQPSV